MRFGARACVGWIMLGVLARAPESMLAQEAGSTGAIDAAHLSPTLYFSSASAELESRNVLHASIAPLVKELAGRDTASPAKSLDATDRAMVALERHAAYLRVKALENTQDQDAKAAGEAVNTDEAVLDAAVRNHLRQVPQSQMGSLGRYAFLAQQANREAAHDFSPDAERYRGFVTAPYEQSIADDYERLIEVIGSNKGVSSLDLLTRRAALTQRKESYDQSAPIAATLLASLVEIENRDAKAQGYADAADRKYNSLGLSTQTVEKTLEAVQAQGGVYRAYEKVLAEHAARRLGISPVLSGELDLAYTASQQIPLDRGSQLILEALQPLGRDYTHRFAQLLDPANGRLDLEGGSHRAHTGTSIAVYDAPVALFFTGYDGSLKSVSTIAHEGGHAIHRELMNVSGLPVYERSGSHFLFEGFAIFNELLILDHAAKIAKTPAERQYALERLLWKLSVELFTSAEETAFEQSLYTEADGHALLDRAAVDATYQKSIAAYEYWPMSDAGSSREWMRKSLLFEDPLYLVNYLYAAVVAVALFDSAHSDPQFDVKYEALLRRGFDAEPQALLASMNIRLDDPDLVKAASRLIRAKTQELNQLYLDEARKPK